LSGTCKCSILGPACPVGCSFLVHQIVHSFICDCVSLLDAVNEETSSACSSETVSEVDGQSARGSEADVGAVWCDKKRGNTSDGINDNYYVFDETYW
jgi:hypothetical protein